MLAYKLAFVSSSSSWSLRFPALLTSYRGRPEILFKCAVSRLLLKAPRANRTLALAEVVVWNARRSTALFTVAIRREVGKRANDIFNDRKASRADVDKVEWSTTATK